jgi:hypothetical protein
MHCRYNGYDRKEDDTAIVSDHKVIVAYTANKEANKGRQTNPSRRVC